MARSNRIYIVRDQVGILGCFTVKWEAIDFAESESADPPRRVWIDSYPDGRYLEPLARRVKTVVWDSDHAKQH